MAYGHDLKHLSFPRIGDKEKGIQTSLQDWRTVVRKTQM